MTARLTAKDRMARLLAVIPWVSENQGAQIDEIERRFDYPRPLLLGDLQDVVFFVGVHPFTPDQLIEVTISDDKVWIEYAEWFSRPLRLSSQDAAKLLAAARAALILTGDDSEAPETLVRALTKLGAMLGGHGDQILDVRLGDARVEILDVIRESVESGVCVEINYYSYGRDFATVREVDPVRLFSDHGNWYLDAWCNMAEDFRMFRVDRIESAVSTRTAARHLSVRTTPPFVPGVDDPRIDLIIDNSAAWVVEQYPCESVSTMPNGQIAVRLAITEVAWLERLLLRLGSAAHVTHQNSDIPENLVGDAARRVLARYVS